MSRILVKKPSKDELESLGVKNWGTWSCGKSTFDWEYSSQETCYIIEGKVTVKTDEEEVSFEKGDLVSFPAGLICVWTVHEPVNKYYKFE
jgi:uncharacterized protein